MDQLIRIAQDTTFTHARTGLTQDVAAGELEL